MTLPLRLSAQCTLVAGPLALGAPAGASGTTRSGSGLRERSVSADDGACRLRREGAVYPPCGPGGRPPATRCFVTPVNGGRTRGA